VATANLELRASQAGTVPMPLQRMGSTGPRDIFLSYGREPDVSGWVLTLKNRLGAEGLTCWLDIVDIPAGSDWHAAIGSGLMSCSFFLPVITRKYLVSKYCKNELYVADSDHTPIFPVFYDEVDLATSPGVKYILSGLNHTKLRSADGGLDGAAFLQLTTALKRELAKRSQTPQTPQSNQTMSLTRGASNTSDVSDGSLC